MADSPQSIPQAWAMLQNELDLWVESGKTATFWWRDDDAVEETPKIKLLDRLSRDMQVPVSVAVIPAVMHDSLVQYLHQRDNFTAMQHGYSHRSYALKAAKKIELGGDRSCDEIQAELDRGRRLLSTAFGEQFIPVLVPPWNRIESRIYPTLASAGFSEYRRSGRGKPPARLKVYYRLTPTSTRSIGTTSEDLSVRPLLSGKFTNTCQRADRRVAI